MASAAVEHPLDAYDPHNSRAARRVQGRTRASRQEPHSSRNQSPPKQRYTLEDEPYISPDSDTEMQGTSQNHEDDVSPASPSRRSPTRQKAAMANNQRDSWAPPSPTSRPTSISGPAGDDARRQSAAAPAGGRYRRHDRSSARPTSGEQSSSFSPSSAWARTGHQQETPGKRSSQQARRGHSSQQADPRHPSAAGIEAQVSPPRGAAAAQAAQTAQADQLNRLGSPSIPETVLGPLMQKIAEYDGMMKDTQRERDQLEDELRALHERLRSAEDRYQEAETKRNEYRRQYEDVDRALRGEFGGGMMPGQQHHQMMAPPAPAPQNVHRPSTMESYEGRPTSNPVSKQSSRTHKLGMGDRIKLSLFGTT